MVVGGLYMVTHGYTLVTQWLHIGYTWLHVVTHGYVIDKLHLSAVMDIHEVVN